MHTPTIPQRWKTLPFLALAILLLLSACENKPAFKPDNPFEYTEEDLPTEEEVAYDNIMEKEHVERATAILCDELTQVTEQLNDVKSPTSIIKAKKAYLNALASLQHDMENLSEDDKKVIRTYQATAEAAYNQACRNYEIPASGVIENLKSLLSNIDQVKTQQDMDHFEESRLGTLRNLDDIHLCIEQNSHQIPEVKRLAQTLKGKYQAKRQELGLE